MIKRSQYPLAPLNDQALYRRGEAVLYRAARIHFRGRRGALRRMVRRYLKPHRRDQTFLRALTSSVSRTLVVALLMLQTWATEVEAQPSFSSSTPANAANNITVSNNISATFTEAIAVGTVTSANFVVHGGFIGKHSTGGTASTHKDGTYTGGGTTTLTYNPGINFKPGELVSVSLTTGLQNGSAQALTAARVYQFRAAASVGPAVFNNSSSDVDTPTYSTVSLSLGDLDGDGDLDLVAANGNTVKRINLGNGNGTFAAGSDGTAVAANSVTLGDVDGDGDLDLLEGNQSQPNRVYLGNGNGTFASGNDVDTPNFATTIVSLGDLDGDGDLDLIAGNYNAANKIYLGNGNGTFATGNNVDTPTNATFEVSLGDLDGDGDLDLVTANYSQVNRVYLGNGNGTFATGNDVDTPTNGTRTLSLGDLDGDGDLDLVTGNGAQANQVYLGNGNGTFATGNNVDTPITDMRGMSLGDLDGDGDLDLIAGNYNAANKIYLGNGNGTFAAGIDAATPTNKTVFVASGDLDGDGDLDFVTANNTQVNRLYLNSNDTDGTLTASATVNESVAIALPSTATAVGSAVDLFDFTLTDGGGADGFALGISQVVINTSGTGPFANITWLLNGPDASNVSGTYSSGTNKITFSTLSISVASGANETYTLRGWYGTATGLTDAATFSFSLDGDTDVTTTGSGSSMSGSNAAVSNAAAAVVGITATQLVYTTQPAPLTPTSGTQLDFTTDPVVAARDANNNTDTDFTSTVTLTENGAGSSSFTNNSLAATSGVATFTGLTLTYTATADQETFELTASASGVTGATSSSLTADVVATQLAFTTQPSPLTPTSGTQLDFTTDPVVTARDANGTTDTGFTSTVTLAENGSGSSSFTNNSLAATSGVATFSGLLLTYTATADQETLGLIASASGVTSATSSTLTADVVATQLVFTTQPAPLALTSSTQLDFTTDPVIIARDANGTTDTGFSSTVTLSETGAGTSTFTNNTATPASGVATFSGLTLLYNALDATSIALSASASGVTSATSSSFAVTAFPLLNKNEGTRVGEGGSVGLSSDLLHFTDAASNNSQLIYTIGTAPAAGQLKKSGTPLAASDTFTQDDLDNSRVSYTHDGGEALVDGFLFTVKGTAGLPTSSFGFDFIITPENDAPVLNVLQRLYVQEGQEITITNGSLRVLDAEVRAQDLVYTLVTLPAHGRLSLNSFTQADINARRLTYRHDGSETTADEFRFTVSDGTGGVLEAQTVTLQIAAVNEAPIVPVFDPPRLDEGQHLLLELQATDPEGDPIALTAPGLPEGATLNGTTLQWQPTYAQAGRYPLVILYDDGRGGVSRLRTDIVVRDVPIPALKPEPGLLNFGDVEAGEAAEETFALSNTTAFPLRLQSFTSDREAFAVTAPTLPLELGVGASVALTARFAPGRTTTAVQRAVLTGTTSAGTVQLPVAGRGLWAGLVSEQDEIDFRSRVLGFEPWYRLTLSNPGNQPLTVHAEDLGDGPFRVEPATLVVAAGAEASLRVYFVAKAVGDFAQTLLLTGGEGVYPVVLRGQATAPPQGRVTIDFNLSPGNQHQHTRGDARPGEIVGLQLHVQRARQLVGWSARLDYDPQALSYISGSFAPGALLPGLVTLESLGDGQVEFGGDALGQGGSASGNGVLGTLAFRVEPGFSDRTELAITRLTWHNAGSGSPAREIVYAPATLTRAPDLVDAPGDFNADGRISIDDFFLFAEQFERLVPPADPRFDLDDDGRVFYGDFFLFADLADPGLPAGKLLALAADLIGVPPQSALPQNYPNPFNAETVLPYAVAMPGRVQLAIYDVTGREVRRLVEGPQLAGYYRAAWDSRDEQGRRVASGLYLARLIAGDQVLSRKLLLIR